MVIRQNLLLYCLGGNTTNLEEVVERMPLVDAGYVVSGTTLISTVYGMNFSSETHLL
jgi:hypothetical protein